MINKPLVSICCTTYNHAPYIRQCLDGFLIQQTSFPFEILIHDDASTDETQDIIKEYKSKYPHLFRLVLQTENQCSKGVSPWTDILFLMTEGKYIAICEGDDYWQDPYKLQKQVDFLEKNLDYGLVHTGCHIFIQDKELLVNGGNLNNLKKNTEEGFLSLLEKNTVTTLTVCFRKDILNVILSLVKGISWDRVLWICISKYTKIHYIPESTGVYRILSESASHSNDPQKLLYNWDKGTDDVLTLLERLKCTENEIKLFLRPRAKYLLYLSYSANSPDKATKYYNYLDNCNSLSLTDIINYYSTKSIVLKIIFDFLRKSFRVVKK
jgi:glycosyltransferase involved in cell wall biosynthesis